jgi:hypothetical protein
MTHETDEEWYRRHPDGRIPGDADDGDDVPTKPTKPRSALSKMGIPKAGPTGNLARIGMNYEDTRLQQQTKWNSGKDSEKVLRGDTQGGEANPNDDGRG